MNVQKEKPNILTIMSDQHSKHVLGCYGNRIIRTPNLDRLAAEGMRFENAYCPAPICVPSRMSFMTSRMPTGNRVWSNEHILPSGIPTWAHVLGAAGYETSLIGRMHFVGPDQRHGFENRPIGEICARPPGTPVAGGPMWTKYPDRTSGQSRQAVEIAGKGHSHYQWFDEECTKVAMEYLRNHASEKQKRPFAATLGYTLPHCPFVALKELFDYYYPRVDIPDIESSQPGDIVQFRKIRGILKDLPEERTRVARAAYFGMVEHMDRLVGRVLDCLDETGLSENTLVVYCADHGEMAGEHGCWWKSNYYEGSVGVPLIFRLPNLIKSGTTCDAVCNLVDLGVTFADMAGGHFKPISDGRSLWQTLNGNHPESWQDKTFSELVEFSEEGESKGVTPSRMIRHGKWKLWLTVDGDNFNPALFNLEDDPGELHDLGKDPLHAEIREQLLKELHENWSPMHVQAMAEDNEESYKTICSWGNAVKPTHPDSITVTAAEYESDVELV